MTASQDPTAEAVAQARLLALYRHLAHILKDLDRQDQAAAAPDAAPPTPTTDTQTEGA